MTPHVVDLRLLKSTDDLGKALSCKTRFDKSVANVGVNQRQYCVEHHVPKCEGDRRRAVFEPEPRLMDTLRAFHRRFDAFAREHISGYPNQYAHGFVVDGGIWKNASVHAGASSLLRADIERFFPSISAAMIESSF